MGAAAKNLKKARHTRHRIASEFSALESGDVSIEDVLGNATSVLNRVRIFDILRRTPHIREEGANNVLKRAKVWPTLRLGNLSSEERRALSRALPERARKP
jgi:hypothetical protein